MQQDEAGTVARLKVLRRELIEPVLGRLGGRFVDLKGDGAIVEFHSAVAAVEAAVEIQRAMAAHEAGRPEDERILYRIGINLGEVVVDGPDIYGDGVNIAARIEALCEPGGVWLAARVYDQVRGKVEVDFEPTGRHRVKNIAEPVEAWRARLDGDPTPIRGRVARRRSIRPALAAAATALMIVLGGVGWYWWPSQAAPDSGKPGIAVLPFANMGGDDATSRLADGISEDIITDLARFKNLDVIARNSTFVYKGKPVNVREVGRDLNVNYVLEGSIQRQSDRIRVTAQLIDTRSDAHVWAERWDRPVSDVFAVQTEVAERVAAAIGGDLTMGMISKNELQRAKRMRPADLKAYDYFQLGKESKATVSNIAQGIAYLDKAIELDPMLARAYSVRGWLHNFSIMFGVEAGPALKRMIADEEKAVALDPQDPESLGSLAFARIFEAQWAEVDTLTRTALELGPGNSHVLALAATALGFIGKGIEGADYADRALRLDPRMTAANLSGLKDAYYIARRYEDTVTAVMRMPEKERSRDSWVFLTASLARLGRTTEVAEARAKTMQAFPTVSAERMINEDYVYARKEDEDLFIEGFRVADLPVCMSVDELATFPSPKRLPECDAERAKAALPKS
jgi:TolB-like protein